MIKYSIYLLLIAIITSSCSNDLSEVEIESTESISELTSPILTEEGLSSPKDSIDSNVIAFLSQFEFDFPDTVDFGWRFIESNYDTIEIKPKGIKYNEKYPLNNSQFFNRMGKPLGKSIEGYAHSYIRLNDDSLAILTLVHGEISQGINLYITDNGLNVLSKNLVASNGGDEGSWFYKYGVFNTTHSYFASKELSGFALDTNEFFLDTFWISAE